MADLPAYRFALAEGASSQRPVLRPLGRELVTDLCRTLAGTGGQLVETPRGPAGAGAWDQLGLSLSYAGRWVLAGVVVEGAIGVDLVETALPPEWRMLARLYLPAAVAADLEGLAMPQRATAFARAWSRLEADLKCAGMALAEGVRPPEPDLRPCPPEPAGHVAAASLRARAGRG